MGRTWVEVERADGGADYIVRLMANGQNERLEWQEEQVAIRTCAGLRDALEAVQFFQTVFTSPSGRTFGEWHSTLQERVSCAVPCGCLAYGLRGIHQCECPRLSAKPSAVEVEPNRRRHTAPSAGMTAEQLAEAGYRPETTPAVHGLTDERQPADRVGSPPTNRGTK